MLTPERKGQIALAFLKYQIREKGISTLRPNQIRREIGNTAKAIGISVEEAAEFAKTLVMEAVNDCFPEPGSFHNEG